MAEGNKYPPNQIWEPIKPKREDYDFYFNDWKTAENVYYDAFMNDDYSNLSIEEYFEEIDQDLLKISEKGCNDNLSLQDIIDLLPPNTNLSNVIFNISFPRDMACTEVRFDIQKRDMEREDKEFQKALKRYNKDMKEYQKQKEKYYKDLEEYNAYVKQKEIKELEEKLARLKQ